MAIHTYNLKDVIIIFKGETMEGFGEDDVIEIEMDEDAFTKQIGADGFGTRSKTNNNAAFATMNLAQTSEANDKLTAIAELDRLGNNGVGAFLVNDLNGTSLHAAQHAWIRKKANAAYARDAGTRQWIIDTDNMGTNFIGGIPANA